MRKADRDRREEWDAQEDVVALREEGRCGHPKTRNRGPCAALRMRGKDGCRIHGGKATGPKQWRAGGRHAQSPAMVALRDHLKQRALNADLLDVGEKIALLDEAEDALLARGVVEKDTPDFRERLGVLMKEFRKAERIEGRGEDADRRSEEVLEDVEKLIREGVEYDQALLEVTSLAERRAKLSLTTRDTMVRESNSFSVEQMMSIYRGLLGVVLEYVTVEFCAGEKDPGAKALPHMCAIDQLMRVQLGAAGSVLTLQREAAS